MRLSLQKFSYLKSANAGYIEDLFERYSENPEAIDSTWRYFFEGLELGAETPEEILSEGAELASEARVAELILAYRTYGRYLADVDPLSPPPASHPFLELSRFGLADADLTKTFAAGKLIGLGPAPLSEILSALKRTYCGTIGVEYMQVEDPTEREWLRARIEGARPTPDPATRKFILGRLTESETFERFLHTRYVGLKRFSIEGGESLIPSLDAMVETLADLGADQFVIGMAHRGRINVLHHVMDKKTEYILTEFEGNYHFDLSHGEGDVKYHMGYSADRKTRTGKPVHLSLANNPSHLEFVDSVVEGMARAKQTYLGDSERKRVIPILIHGDASFAGQGVVYETLNLSQLEGYGTGGTLHIIANNQVGFTTSPGQSRSTTYSTDLAKMLDAPIFHVNGDDADAVWMVSRLAAEYRQKFHKDVFIDLICYRKHGHNEGDEPSFTQPLLYKKIKAHASTREVYAQKLASEGVASLDEAQKMIDAVNESMSKAQATARASAPHPEPSVFEGRWKGYRQPSEEDHFKPIKTAVDTAAVVELAKKLNTMPAGFHLHPKLPRFFEARQKAFEDGKGIDWGNGETMAYATLLTQGYGVRLSGQDAERGTFTHRHSVVNDYETGERYCALNHLRDGQARFEVHNSHLSETGVMGFEYGYSITDPKTLPIWEAQFGDFANGAQVIIDQFLAAAESKWRRMSGLTLLLPHAYEGQGAEHSSARLERFLQLSARYNLIIANFTTPAQIFHGLRRQMLRDFRKPLVIMSPKSLLRHPLAVSAIEDFT
ncbi:MAG: 2-oxoglutarate dehydrogenase E1 component, partial [Bdellovibrionota bacterium]